MALPDHQRVASPVDDFVQTPTLVLCKHSIVTPTQTRASRIVERKADRPRVSKVTGNKIPVHIWPRCISGLVRIASTVWIAGANQNWDGLLYIRRSKFGRTRIRVHKPKVKLIPLLPHGILFHK